MRLLLIDSDYTYNRMSEPVVRLFGKIVGGENEGSDICVHVLGFHPYIYLGNCGMDVFELKKIVEGVAKGYLRSCDIVMRFMPIGFQKDKVAVLKLVLFNPKVVPELRKLLKEKIPEVTDSQLFEADLPYATTRFLIDAGISGMDVIEFAGEKIPNYGLGIKNDNIYICKMSDIKVLKDDVVKIEY